MPTLLSRLRPCAASRPAAPGPAAPGPAALGLTAPGPAALGLDALGFDAVKEMPCRSTNIIAPPAGSVTMPCRR
ncbi:MAG: hypothetical protein EBS23_04985 [Betaproteobacteria bacterium]|nr:hypothetical protein [Betaproteobacteria bacterium]